MKTLKWFKVGDHIPDGSLFIKSEMRMDPHYPSQPIEYFLYEVPLPPEHREWGTEL